MNSSKVWKTAKVPHGLRALLLPYYSLLGHDYFFHDSGQVESDHALKVVMLLPLVCSFCIVATFLGGILGPDRGLLFVALPALLAINVGLIVLFRVRGSLQRQQLEFLGLFLIYESWLVLRSTNSLRAAIDYLLKLMPKRFQSLVRARLILGLMKQTPIEDVIFEVLSLLKMDWTRAAMAEMLQNGSKGLAEVDMGHTQLWIGMKNNIEVDNKAMELWSAIFSALATLIPIMAILVALLTGIDAFSSLLSITVFLVFISVVFKVLDPFGTNIVQESGILAISAGWEYKPSDFALNIAARIGTVANVEKAVTLGICSLFRGNSGFKRGRYLKGQQLLSPATKRIVIGRRSKQPSLFMLLAGLANTRTFAETHFRASSSIRFKLLVDLCEACGGIESKKTAEQLVLLSKALKENELQLQNKMTTIRAEIRKNLALAVFQAISFGILLSLAPIFSSLTEFKTILTHFAAVRGPTLLNAETEFEMLSITIVMLFAQVVAFRSAFRFITVDSCIIWHFLLSLCCTLSYFATKTFFW